MSDRRPEIHLNVGIPALAVEAASLPAAGVGLLRAEFLALGEARHPSAVLEEGGEDAFVRTFAKGLETVARAFHPRPVVYRTLDLKSNEYRSLAGGDRFEPHEENPMLGLRGVARYLVRPDELRLELQAVADVLATGLDNVSVCVPFVRTLDELRAVKRAVADAGLVGAPGFELWAMAEVPSTALLAERFAAEVDGLSVGSNDLTQLVLGVDRDSAAFSGYDAEDEAVLAAVALVVAGAHAAGIPVCSCGDAPSRSPALVARLVDLGVDRISVPPTAFADTVAAVDAALAAGARP